MYEKLNYLAGSLAPTYSSQGYMSGNLHRLTVGNYITNQYGIINGFTYDIDESPWEDEDGKQLPKYIKITGIKFIPIHNFRPESHWNKFHDYIYQKNQTKKEPPSENTLTPAATPAAASAATPAATPAAASAAAPAATPPPPKYPPPPPPKNKDKNKNQQFFQKQPSYIDNTYVNVKKPLGNKSLTKSTLPFN